MCRNPLIKSFHAHIYYDKDTKNIATFVRQSLKHAFISNVVRLGKMHDKPIGPHTKPMFQVAFSGTILRKLINQLMYTHSTLSVLIHPETGNDKDDHTEYAMWLGKPVELDLTKL